MFLTGLSALASELSPSSSDLSLIFLELFFFGVFFFLVGAARLAAAPRVGLEALSSIACSLAASAASSSAFTDFLFFLGGASASSSESSSDFASRFDGLAVFDSTVEGSRAGV